MTTPFNLNGELPDETLVRQINTINAKTPNPANFMFDTLGNVNGILNQQTQQLLNATALVCTGIPFVLPSNGTMGNNGALSAIVALPTAYQNAYVYCPASMIYAGSAAGWYFAQFSSTTAATIYNNVYSSGTPTIPSSPTPFVCTGVGTFTTQANSAPLQTVNITIPAGSMGNNGKLRLRQILSTVNNSDGVRGGALLGGTNFCYLASTTTSSTVASYEIWNNGNQAINTGSNYNSGGVSASTCIHGTINTANAQTLSAYLQLTTGDGATDWIVQEHLSVELMYGA